jgi:Rod binding domain-containing protein
MSLDAIATTSGLLPPASRATADSPAKVQDAARQFEALLLSQMLKSARQAGAGGWLGTGDDPSASSAMEIAEEQFAQALSSGGGLGLAKLIVSGLEAPRRPAAPASSTAGSSGATGAPSREPVHIPAESGG